MNKESIFFCIVISLFFAGLGFAFGNASDVARSRQNFEREAITKGHAVWITDEKGCPVFQWKEVSK